jgi:hypothetical protein
VLVRRGNPEVARNVADNQTARLSEGGFSALVRRAEGDGDLAEKVGQRPDIPAHLFRDLLIRATVVVQQRLLASAKPETRAEIQRILDKVSKDLSKSAQVRDYSAAQRAVLELHEAGNLTESKPPVRHRQQIRGDSGRASLLCGVPIETVDGSRRSPTPLILCKSGRLADREGDYYDGWVLKGRPARYLRLCNFDKLSPATAACCAVLAGTAAQ